MVVHFNSLTNALTRKDSTMLTSAGILLFVTGASLTFAVEREVEGLDLEVVGWIMMAGGVTAFVFAITLFAGLVSEARAAIEMRQVGHGDASAAGPAHHLDYAGRYGRPRVARWRGDGGWAA